MQKLTRNKKRPVAFALLERVGGDTNTGEEAENKRKEYKTRK
jgi:hypothetical protein